MTDQSVEEEKIMTEAPTRSPSLKKFALSFACVALAFVPLSACRLAHRVQSRDRNYTTIDYPEATFTDAVGINCFGDIVGHYIDAAGTDHGYLLHKGRFTSIDFPGSSGGHSHDINSAGTIVGQYFIGETGHGYLRSNNRFSTIDFPDATDCRANGINSVGEIVGSYENGKSDKENRSHGFLLQAGTFSSIDFPGASYTEAWRINDGRQIVGRYRGADGNFHIYLLTIAARQFISIDYPGAAQTAVGEITPIGGLNNDGDIASGYCNSSNCEVESVGTLYGFLLRGGSFSTLSVPASAGTIAFGINDCGEIVGGYTDANLRVHGYVRNRSR